MSEADEHRYDDEWIRAFFLSLREGDEVIVNGRNRPLTVTDRWWDDRESGYYRYTLEGYGTTYRTIIDEDTAVKLTTVGGRTMMVNTVEVPEGETHAVSDVTAAEFIDDVDGFGAGSVVHDQAPTDRTTSTDAEAEGEHLGTCPDCGEVVVEDANRAVCTGCELWCPIDEWTAFENAEGVTTDV